MIVSTAGFSGTGSSAVNEFLAEFEENQVYSRDEFIISYCPDGIEDLDYHLNKGASKFLSSCVAIPRFRKAMNYRLKVETKGKIKELTNAYLDKIIQTSWTGTGQGQEALHNGFLYQNLGVRINMRISKKMPRKLFEKLHLYPLGKMEFSVEPDDFYTHTKDYIDSIFLCFGLDLKKNIVLDQAFAGNNPTKSFPYFRNPKAIVVDRDPRDLYTLFKFVYDRLNYVVPIDNVEDFVTYFLNMHKSMKVNNNCEDVLTLRFEDMVYNYEETTKKIVDFLGLHEHTTPKKYFIPEQSMINTQVYKKHPEISDDIKYIETHLSDYLFDFDKYEYKPSISEEFVFNPNVEHGLFSIKRLFSKKKKYQ